MRIVTGDNFLCLGLITYADDIVIFSVERPLKRVMGMKAKSIIVLGLLIVALCISAVAQEKGTLRVMGVGTVTVPVDTVIVTITAQSSNDNATLGTAENADLLNKTIDALSVVGLKEMEIVPGRSKGAATYYSRVCDRMNNTTTCRDVVTNLVTEQMAIRLNTSDENRVNEILEAAKSTGANPLVSGYALSDTSKVVEVARKMAIDNARANAEDYAEAFGFGLGNPKEIKEIAYPDIELGSAYGWDRPFRVHHPLWINLPWRMDRFFGWRQIPPGMAEVTAYVEVTYEVL